MILHWRQNSGLEGAVLEWRHNKPQLNLQWSGPNLINTAALSAESIRMSTTFPELIETKIAIIMGPPGKPGEQGEPGERGPPGAGGATVIYSPPEAQVSWLIAHNLGQFPAVTTVDSTGRVVNGEITYHNNNLVEIAFAFPVSGTAYLN